MSARPVRADSTRPPQPCRPTKHVRIGAIGQCSLDAGRIAAGDGRTQLDVGLSPADCRRAHRTLVGGSHFTRFPSVTSTWTTRSPPCSRHHIESYPPALIELPDVTAGTPDPGKKPKRRSTRLVFVDELGRPIHNQRWSEMFQEWRRPLGWTDEATFHSLPPLVAEEAAPPECVWRGSPAGTAASVPSGAKQDQG